MKKIIIIVILVGLALIGISLKGLYALPEPTKQPINKGVEETKPEPNTNIPYVVSTNPAGIKDRTVIVPSDVKVEVRFSAPFENRGEVKSKITPEIDYKIELSNDKQTVYLLFTKPLELGREYTFIITEESKFDNKKKLDSGQIFHFATIAYRGV